MKIKSEIALCTSYKFRLLQCLPLKFRCIYHRWREVSRKLKIFFKERGIIQCALLSFHEVPSDYRTLDAERRQLC